MPSSFGPMTARYPEKNAGKRAYVLLLRLSSGRPNDYVVVVVLETQTTERADERLVATTARCSKRDLPKRKRRGDGKRDHRSQNRTSGNKNTPCAHD